MTVAKAAAQTRGSYDFGGISRMGEMEPFHTLIVHTSMGTDVGEEHSHSVWRQVHPANQDGHPMSMIPARGTMHV